MKSRNTSWPDIVVLLAAALITLSIALVRVQHQRELARGQSCENNLKQLGLAIHNYHSAYKRLPMGCGGTSAVEDSEPWRNNASRLSPWVGLLPFYEQQALWEKIANPMQAGAIKFPPMGPVPWYDPKVYTPWSERPEILVCPSDNNAAKFGTVSSYVINYGDAVQMVGVPVPLLQTESASRFSRGMFVGFNVTRFRDCLDGLSNTLMFSESCIANQPVAKGVVDLAFNPSLCIEASKNKDGEFWPAGREACWADGCLRSSGFQTILPPNSPSATSDTNELGGIMSASSYHPGGVHVCFADGRVQFVLDSIDAGRSQNPTVAVFRDGRRYTEPGRESPYGLWGALGTRAMKETIVPNESIVAPPKELTEADKELLQAKPLQTWTAAVGGATLQARQVDLQRDSIVILLTENGDTKSVPLSRLSSADAYRAVQQHLAEKMRARTELKTQLQSGVAMLENKQYEEFAKTFLAGADADAKGMANLVEIERGMFIYMFDSMVRQLAMPGTPGVEFRESESGQIGVRFSPASRPFVSRLQLLYSQGRWQFQLK